MNRLFKGFLLLTATALTSAPAMAQEIISGTPTFGMTQLLAFPLFLMALWLFVRMIKAKSKTREPNTFSQTRNRAQTRAGKKHASGR